MPTFKRFTGAVHGGDVYVNVELVTYVSEGRGERGGTLIHFDKENAVLVEGDTVDVMDQLPPLPKAPTGASGTYRKG